jgi:hypothetical protein
MALAGDHVQVLVGGFELTGDMNRIGVADRHTMHDVTAFSDAAHRFIAGQRQITLDHAGYLNAQAARSHPVLRGSEVSGVVSLLVGQNTAPIVGDPAFSLSMLQGRYQAMPEVSRVVPFKAQLVGRGTAGGWGRVLANNATFTNSTDGTAVDNGAATSSGGAAFLHILQAAASDTYAISVQGATDAGFTTGVVTLATFTLNAAQVNSERIAITGSIPQYTRWRAVRTGAAGNTVRLSVTLVRL